LTDISRRKARIRVSRKTQLALAGLMWTAVGIMLPTLGLVWGVQSYGVLGLLFAVPFLAVGLLKSKILDRVSAGTIAHIRSRDPEGFVLGFLPLKSWVLIAGMMATGQVLRHTLFAEGGPWPRAWLGFVYVAVGSALLLSSRKLWQGWREQAV
jgi:hypothetical protein